MFVLFFHLIINRQKNQAGNQDQPYLRWVTQRYCIHHPQAVTDLKMIVINNSCNQDAVEFPSCLHASLEDFKVLCGPVSGHGGDD